MSEREKLSSVVLYVNGAGIVQRVEINGENIANVAKASIVMQPGEIARLELSVFVGDVVMEDA